MISCVPIMRMNGHLEVPIHTPEAARLSQLLPYKQPAPANPLESTVPQVLILTNLKPFRINTYEKTVGGPSHAFSASLLAFTPKETPSHSSKFRLRASIIPFVFRALRTLLRHGRSATLLESIRCALFLSPRGCVPLKGGNCTGLKIGH
jgi:hypothetical protein